jgi:glycosyltransferase involved in cell wall biosynthesis
MSARVSVIIPCFNDGRLVVETVRSVSEREEIELVVVDDCSTDAYTRQTLVDLEAEGIRVIRHERNAGVATARMSGLAATDAPYVFPLDSDDLAVEGALEMMADKLDATPEAAVCFGDYLEFGDSELVRAVPEQIDPYRLAYTNEYPITALFRRSWLERLGGWAPDAYRGQSYEDWNLWMSLAEDGAVGVHAGIGVITYRRRLHGERKLMTGKRRHRELYRQLRDNHASLFSQLLEHRRKSDLSAIRKLLYPVVYGRRRRWKFEGRVKATLDRFGVWTLRREVEAPQALARVAVQPQVRDSVEAGRKVARDAAVAEGGARIAVVIPCHGDGETVVDAVRSVSEAESVELVVVDDGSTDDFTRETLERLEAEGVRVVRHGQNRGVAAARMTGLGATSAPYVFPLDADDLAIAGPLERMADTLDSVPQAAVCFGDYLEFGDWEIVRAVPEQIDAYRLAYTNEYPITALYRRSVIEPLGAWQPDGYQDQTYEDWSLWMALAEHGEIGVHAGIGVITYRRRLHGSRRLAVIKRSHRELYGQLRTAHPNLFSRLPEYRRQSDLSPIRKLLYPVVYGRRPRFAFERHVKWLLDRTGVWTLRR